MARKAHRTGQMPAYLAQSQSEGPPSSGNRRARAEIQFEEATILGALFGQFDANLVQIENRLGVYIAARGNRVQIEGPEDAVARAADVLRGLHQRLMIGQEIDSGAVESLIMMSHEPTLEGIITGHEDAPSVVIRRSTPISARSTTRSTIACPPSK